MSLFRKNSDAVTSFYRHESFADFVFASVAAREYIFTAVTRSASHGEKSFGYQIIGKGFYFSACCKLGQIQIYHRLIKICKAYADKVILIPIFTGV